MTSLKKAAKETITFHADNFIPDQSVLFPVLVISRFVEFLL